MKIYFEDGRLLSLNQLKVQIDAVIDATDGVSANYDSLNELRQKNPEMTIYTNSLIAFSNKYAWNDKLKAPEIYIRAGMSRLFTRIDSLTTRELREGHNLAKLYIGGEFNIH